MPRPAADYLKRALEINPNYAFAKEKLNQLEPISGGQGHRSRPAPPAEQPKFWAPVPPAPGCTAGADGCTAAARHTKRNHRP